MKGFIAALAVLLAVTAAAVGCTVYVRGVLDKTEAMITHAQSPKDMTVAADYVKKEKTLLYLMVKESQIDKLISGAENVAALWDTPTAREAATDTLLMDLEALKRSFGANPL